MADRTFPVQHEKGPRSLGLLTWLGVAFVALVVVLAGVGALELLRGARESAEEDPMGGMAMWGVIALAVVGGVPAILTTLGLAVSWWWPRATTVLVASSAAWIVVCGLFWIQRVGIPI